MTSLGSVSAEEVAAISSDASLFVGSNWRFSNPNSNAGQIKLYTPPVCAVNERVSNYACTSCPQGSSNEAGDSILIDSTCDPIICAEREKVVNFACEACDAGQFAAAGSDATQGDTTCTTWICAENERVQNKVCVACDAGYTRPAGDDAFLPVLHLP